MGIIGSRMQNLQPGVGVPNSPQQQLLPREHNTTTGSDEGRTHPENSPTAESVSNQQQVAISNLYFGPQFVFHQPTTTPRGTDTSAAPQLPWSFWNEIFSILSFRSQTMNFDELSVLGNLYRQSMSEAQTVQMTTTLQAQIHLIKDTIELISTSEHHNPADCRLRFRFDCSSTCWIKIFSVVKEVRGGEVSVGKNTGQGVSFKYKNGKLAKPLIFGPYNAGCGQQFEVPYSSLFEPGKMNSDDIFLKNYRAEDEDEVLGNQNYDVAGVNTASLPDPIELAEIIIAEGTTSPRNEPTLARESINVAQVSPDRKTMSHLETLYPIVICLEAVSASDAPSRGTSSSNTESLLRSPNFECTYATLLKKSDESLGVRAVKQKIFINDTPYLLQEIFGFSDNIEASCNDLSTLRECIVCMSAPRDTLVIPCRHMCLCRECGEMLMKANAADSARATGPPKCPICRQVFHSLLELQVPKEYKASLSLASSRSRAILESNTTREDREVLIYPNAV